MDLTVKRVATPSKQKNLTVHLQPAKLFSSHILFLLCDGVLPARSLHCIGIVSERSTNDKGTKYDRLEICRGKRCFTELPTNLALFEKLLEALAKIEKKKCY